MRTIIMLLRQTKNVPGSLKAALYASLLKSGKKPVPALSHYITSDGMVMCTSSGLRYAVKEE